MIIRNFVVGDYYTFNLDTGEKQINDAIFLIYLIIRN